MKIRTGDPKPGESSSFKLVYGRSSLHDHVMADLVQCEKSQLVVDWIHQTQNRVPLVDAQLHSR